MEEWRGEMRDYRASYKGKVVTVSTDRGIYDAKCKAAQGWGVPTHKVNIVPLDAEGNIPESVFRFS